MNQHLEIEYKILLTKDIYQQVLSDYQSQIQKQYSQTNYYFMHPTLEKNRYMLRIRKINETYELTLKEPTAQGNLETNITLSKETAEAILNKEKVTNAIFDKLEAMGILLAEMDTRYSLTTYRTDILLAEGTLSIDQNTYLGITDYEMEFEVTNAESGYQQFLSIIAPYAITYQTNCCSKIQRLLANKN